MRILVRSKKAIIITFMILLLVVGSVWAEDGETPDVEIPECAGVNVQGTVVDADESTGVVTVYTDGGLCTVTLAEGDYDHPIVNLLGRYFDSISAQSLLEALDSAETEICALPGAEGDPWTWVECSDDLDEVTMTIIGVNINPDGTFTFVALYVDEEGYKSLISVSVEDEDVADSLLQELATVAVSWDLSEDGAIIQSGDLVAYYHSQGIGFGVLVKLFAMSQELEEACLSGLDPDACEVTLEDLIQAFEAGTGLGELFELYGKPELLGVGHVRKASEMDGETSKKAKKWADSEKPGRPDQAGPKEKYENGPSENAGPKDKDKDNGKAPGPKDKSEVGPPDHAGPKDKDNGKALDHAGPKDKNEGAPPENAGPKDKDKDNGNSSNNGGGKDKDKKDK